MPLWTFRADGRAKEKLRPMGRLSVAIVGSPNVGKSSLVNYSIRKEDRCIVSPIAGTTRDSVDISFTRR